MMKEDLLHARSFDGGVSGSYTKSRLLYLEYIVCYMECTDLIKLIE